MSKKAGRAEKDCRVLDLVVASRDEFTASGQRLHVLGLDRRGM